MGKVIEFAVIRPTSFGFKPWPFVLSMVLWLSSLSASLFPASAQAQQEDFRNDGYSEESERVREQIPSATFPNEGRARGQAPQSESQAEKSEDAMAVETSNAFTSLLNPYDYDSRGRPDPFAKPTSDTPVSQGVVHGVLTPLQRYELSDLRLVGILWNVNSPKAMLRDPAGGTHIVTSFAKIGPRNGYIATIREGEIVVVETTEFEGRPVSTAQVVKIAR